MGDKIEITTLVLLILLIFALIIGGLYIYQRVLYYIDIFNQRLDEIQATIQYIIDNLPFR
jgi:hypothetical protein